MRFSDLSVAAVRVHRALSRRLREQAGRLATEGSPEAATAALVLHGMAEAHLNTAVDLEAGALR